MFGYTLTMWKPGSAYGLMLYRISYKKRFLQILNRGGLLFPDVHSAEEFRQELTTIIYRGHSDPTLRLKGNNLYIPSKEERKLFNKLAVKAVMEV